MESRYGQKIDCCVKQAESDILRHVHVRIPVCDILHHVHVRIPVCRSRLLCLYSSHVVGIYSRGGSAIYSTRRRGVDSGWTILLPVSCVLEGYPTTP